MSQPTIFQPIETGRYDSNLIGERTVFHDVHTDHPLNLPGLPISLNEFQPKRATFGFGDGHHYVVSEPENERHAAATPWPRCDKGADFEQSGPFVVFVVANVPLLS